MTTVLVCGGRDYTSTDEAFRILDKCHKQWTINRIIQGGARGADTIAKNWADSRNIECVEYPADWNTHGKAAGPIRNIQMLNDGKPDCVVAFKGGRGTAHMVESSMKRGIFVLQIPKY